MIENKASYFHRTKRESWLWIVLGLAILFSIGLFLVLLGAVNFERESDGLIFSWSLMGIGLSLLVLFFRGAWKLIDGRPVHVISLDEEKFVWGSVGSEKEIDLSEIREFYWDDTEDFTFHLDTKKGKRIRLPYISHTVGLRSRRELLASLRNHPAEVPVRGFFSKYSLPEDLEDDD